MDVCVARQPIFDSQREVFGYELLFRSGTENVFCNTDGDEASARVMSDSLYLHGLEALTDGRLCFINITRRILLEELYHVLPPKGTVLELLENIEPDEDVVAACRRLRKAGYTLALDDYVYEKKFDVLLPMLDILKVDFLGMSPEKRREIVEYAEEHQIRLLAEKVESHADFEEARDLGYHYFQGYFFCKPEMITSKGIVPVKATYLRFLQKVNEPAIKLDALAEIIQQDLALSYKLLRYLNSGAFRFRKQITSIRHGLTLLGDRPLRKWASLVAMGQLADGKPPELLSLCMIRGRFCEVLGEAAGMERQASNLFLTGMFSLLDAMLDRPMEEIVSQISVPDRVKQSLVGERTPLRPILDLAVAFERGQWKAIAEAVDALGVQEQAVSQAYRESIQWSSELTSAIGGSTPAATAERRAS